MRLDKMNSQKIYGSPPLQDFMYVSAATFELRNSDLDPYVLIVKNSIFTGKFISQTFIKDI
jgi:hypothetical protein